MIKVNPDGEEVNRIREALAKNGGYCPCSLYMTPDTKCMCKAFREQEEGWCHCGLYFKEK